MRPTAFLTAAATAFCLMAGSAMASTVVIDFDSEASGFYDASYDFGGVSFEGLAVQQFQVLPAANTAPGPGQAGQVGRVAVPPFGGDPRGGTLSGSFFGNTVSFISVIVGDSGGDLDTFNLQGFDALGALVAETGLQASASAVLLSISGAGISNFLLTIGDPNSGGSSVIDNFSFTPEMAAVPVPAALPLLGFGLIAFGAVARRKRRLSA